MLSISKIIPPVLQRRIPLIQQKKIVFFQQAHQQYSSFFPIHSKAHHINLQIYHILLYWKYFHLLAEGYHKETILSRASGYHFIPVFIVPSPSCCRELGFQIPKSLLLSVNIHIKASAGRVSNTTDNGLLFIYFASSTFVNTFGWSSTRFIKPAKIRNPDTCNSALYFTKSSSWPRTACCSRWAQHYCNTACS